LEKKLNEQEAKNIKKKKVNRNTGSGKRRRMTNGIMGESGTKSLSWMWITYFGRCIILTPVFFTALSSTIHSGVCANEGGSTSLSSNSFSKCRAALAFVLSDYSARTVK